MFSGFSDANVSQFLGNVLSLFHEQMDAVLKNYLCAELIHTDLLVYLQN